MLRAEVERLSRLLGREGTADTRGSIRSSQAYAGDI